MVTIALAQINPTVGDLEGNTTLIIEHIRIARARGADIVVFPELALTGYPPEDLLLKPHFIKKNLRCLDVIRKVSKGIITLVGFVDAAGPHLYNACALIQDGTTAGVYHKMYLPNYSVFDEARYFTAGDSLLVTRLGSSTFALSICEDIWKADFVNSLKKTNVDFVVNISASVFHLGKVHMRQRALSNAAKIIGSPVIYCNLVGAQDELVFDGTSMVFDARGRLCVVGKRFSEDFIQFSLNARQKFPVTALAAREDEETYEALRLGLSDYVRKNNFGKVIIGISGGVDSAVVAGLAVASLGKENVWGLIMPSRYTSAQTLADAQKLCHNLGIEHYTVTIEEIFTAFLTTLDASFKGKSPDKTEENLQARIRGSLLMAFSNKFGYLVLNTGNKSEVSCGYCTLYGDMVGGFGVLKDLSKDLVYKVARYINAKNGIEIIPESIIARPPSAELKPNQKDSDSLPPYPVLDPILRLYVEEDFSLEKIVKKGYNRALVKRVIAMVDGNEYKRRQAPIGIKITPRAFGKDRRMPITNRFREEAQ